MIGSSKATSQLLCLIPGVLCVACVVGDDGAPGDDAMGDPDIAIIESGTFTPIKPDAEKVSFVVVSSVVKRAPFDPIVHFGETNAGHDHTFSGNVTISPTSTTATLLAGSTNSALSGDKSSYWLPTLYANGQAVTPYTTRAYYRAGTTNLARIKAMPVGLKMIAGNANATGPQNAGIAGFHCRNADGAVTSKQATPPACPSGTSMPTSCPRGTPRRCSSSSTAASTRPSPAKA